MSNNMERWSPSIHYAQRQTLQKGKLARRRIYDFELLYLCEGEAATNMNNQRYHLNKGDLIVLPAGVYHQNEVISETASFIGIHFDFFDELQISREEDIIIHEQDVQSHKLAKEGIIFPFTALTKHPVYEPSKGCVKLMEELIFEFNQRAPGYELVCRALMLQILVSLSRLQLTKRFEPLSTHTFRIKSLLNDIQAHPEYDWNNAVLAKRLNLNEDYMAKLFKKYTGISPKEHIRLTRHHLARQLLRESNYSIHTISIKVGYTDTHYFSRTFSHIEGISPTEYRKLSRIL